MQFPTASSLLPRTRAAESCHARSPAASCQLWKTEEQFSTDKLLPASPKGNTSNELRAGTFLTSLDGLDSRIDSRRWRTYLCLHGAACPADWPQQAARQRLE